MASTSNLESNTPNSYEKAHIFIHDKNGINNYDKFVRVMFNPQQYTIDKSNQFANMAIPGRQSPIMQFIKGESETLTVELFFDTYTNTYTQNPGEDVRNYTRPIIGLLDIDSETHAPPVCTFAWGDKGPEKDLYFTGVIEKATTTFTMFHSNGNPVRAKINLTFRQFQSNENKKLHSADKTKRITIVSGDSLWLLASKEYGDPAKWRSIADANNIDDPLSLESGTEIIVPKLD
jgi:Contractile injection system tube protein/LysM domain